MCLKKGVNVVLCMADIEDYFISFGSLIDGIQVFRFIILFLYSVLDNWQPNM